MDIPVLDYEEHSDIASAADFVRRLADFALACGWSVIDEQAGYKWASLGGGVYGWVADTTTYPESFLCLENTRGQQIRFQVISMASGELHYMYVRGYTASSTWSTSSSTNPAQQTTGQWGTQALVRNPVPTTNWQRTWLFGDSSAIYVVVQFDSDFCLSIGFGTHDLIETTNYVDYGFIIHSSHCVGSTGYESTISGVKNSTYYLNCLDEYNRQYIRYKTACNVTAGDARLSFCRNIGAYAVMPTYIAGVDYGNICVIENLHSSQTLLMRQYISIKDPDDNLWFLSGAFHAVRFQHSNNDLIGYGFSLDTEQYIAFPGKNRQSDFNWYAFRVA